MPKNMTTWNTAEPPRPPAHGPTTSELQRQRPFRPPVHHRSEEMEKAHDFVERCWRSDSVSRQIEQFDHDFANMKWKMHRFPLALSHLHKQYGVPVLMSIGPSPNRGENLYLDMVKNVATRQFRLEARFVSVDEMFMQFCSDVGDVGRLCRERTDPNNIKLKFDMLRYGCFLLEYMQIRTSAPNLLSSTPKLLLCYVDSNKAAIDCDIMVLENQVPWVVIETLAGYKEQGYMSVKEFVAKMTRTLQVQVRRGADDGGLPDLGHRQKKTQPSHLLGLLRSYKAIGDSHDDENGVQVDPAVGATRFMSKTISAIELAEIGIKLTASKTTRFNDMGIKKTLLGAEIFLVPLLLDEIRQCWLVNMVAFELSVAPYAASSTNLAGTHAVSAYLVVLAMLMDREEDVHALRSNGLLLGQRTNKEILYFFKDLVKNISGGPTYVQLMQDIEDYKLKRWMWIKLYKFFYKNYGIILAVITIIGVLTGIFKALPSVKHY